MQVATGKSILNGIAIGKIKIYKAPKHEIPMELITDVQAELDRFEDAVQKVIDQQTVLYEKAKVSAGEDSAAIFEVHAMMMQDDDLLDAAREIISKQKRSAEYAVDVAFQNQAEVFGSMDDEYFKARSADIIDLKQSTLDVLMGIDTDSMQGSEPAILVAEDLAPS